LQDRKNIIAEYFKLVGIGKFKEGLHFFCAWLQNAQSIHECSIEGLIDAMIAGSKDFSMQSSNIEFKVQQILADGDSLPPTLPC